MNRLVWLAYSRPNKRVQNCFASYEVHIGHFFYSVKVIVNFGNV